MASFTVEEIDRADAEQEYAYTRAVSPTGDMVMRGPTWKGEQPMAAVIINTVSTAQGSYAPDRLFGMDYSAFDHLTQASVPKIEYAIRDCLKYLTEGGFIRRLGVKAAVQRMRNGTMTALADISFYDPRSRRNVRVKGKF